MSLKNKRILITAGPTWVAIDAVRVISNIATGQTGILLAEEFLRRNARVTLFLGPVRGDYLNHSLRILRFKFFDELRIKIKEELCKKRYDIIIHNAAVSDFRPGRFRKKIDSKKECNLGLKPLPKIIHDIRGLSPCSKLVIFKFEPGVSDRILIKRARQVRQEAGAEFIVANRLNPYRAFIIDKEGDQIKVRNKKDLARKLIKQLSVVSYRSSDCLKSEN
jgi:phosphopantothenoylcysteine decarboxylase/phosphopantothenate--cysteine ligase